MTSPAGGKLPPVTVARFEQVTTLIERLAQEKTSIFFDAMNSHLERHRAATQRPLTPQEAVGLATTVSGQLGRDDLIDLTAEIQASEIRETGDTPNGNEILLAAGLRTAPAFVDAALRVCALIELPVVEFDAALDADDLDTAISKHAATLRKLQMADARERASAALTHFTTQVGGATPGEAWSLLTSTVWQAVKTAFNQIDGSAFSSPTSSPAPTDGHGETS